jgi:hypothetical protein
MPTDGTEFKDNVIRKMMPPEAKVSKKLAN